MHILLSVEDLSISFPGETAPLEAVSGVSFTIDRGEIVGLVGESGCGKSVTAFSIVGLVPRPGVIAGGAVRLNGTNLLEQTRSQWRQVRGNNIGVIFQDAMAALTPTLPVGKQVADAMEAHLSVSARDARLRAIEMLDRVGIPDPARRSKSYPHEFSGGMRQRVMIAQALSCQPELLIADEPTTALDVTVQAEILRLLQDLRDDFGMGVLFITHDLGVIARVADSVSVMYAGRVVESGPVVPVFEPNGHPYTEGLLRATPRIDIATVPNPIPGRVPGLSERVVGCQFRPRCPYAFGACLEEPPLDPVGKTPIPPSGSGATEAAVHHAACWAVQPDGSLPEKTRDLDSEFRPEVSALAEDRVASTTPLIELRDVSVTYRTRNLRGRGRTETVAVDNVSLALHAGETLGIVGESGSGKSSIARALMGIVPYSSGGIEHGGEDLKVLLRRRDHEWRRRVQMVFQDPYSSLDPSMTVGKIIREGIDVHGLVPRAGTAERVGELLSAVGLDPASARRYPRQFSGGQRQRIAIARALAVEPEVIVCDEAVSSLDVSVQAQILELLHKLKEGRGLAYVFISHDLGVVRQIADRVIVLHHGKVVETADDDSIFEHPKHPYTAALLSAVPIPDPIVEQRRGRVRMQEAVSG